MVSIKYIIRLFGPNRPEPKFPSGFEAPTCTGRCECS